MAKISPPRFDPADTQRLALPPTTGRVSVRDPDGGRHLIEVLGHLDRSGHGSTYQVKIDGWYHVAWAASADEVRLALDRVRRAVISGWLPGDSDLPS